MYKDGLITFVNKGRWSAEVAIVMKQNRSGYGSGLLQTEEGMHAKPEMGTFAMVGWHGN